MKVDNFLTDLYKVYNKKYSYSYNNIKDISELELISFSYGILIILQVLKIDPEKIKVANRTLKDELDDIIKGYLKEDNRDYKPIEKDSINDCIHDKDDVCF